MIRQETGQHITRKLTLMQNIPDTLKYLNFRFLTDVASFRLFPLCFFDPFLNIFNPSIAAHDNELFFSLRHSNCLAAGNLRHYQAFNYAISHNEKHQVDQASFGKLSLTSNTQPRYTIFENRVAGFEDLRIFRHGGRWLAFGTKIMRDVSKENLPTMHLLKFNELFQLQESMYLPSPISSRREKNWVPLCKGESLFVIYRPVPLDVYLIDQKQNRMTPVVLNKNPLVNYSINSDSHWHGIENIPWSGSSQFVQGCSTLDTESALQHGLAI
jgi:hypothetical protein